MEVGLSKAGVADDGAHLVSLSGSCSPSDGADRALRPGVQHRGGALLGEGLHHPRRRDAGADLPGHWPSPATGEPLLCPLAAAALPRSVSQVLISSAED